LNLASRGVFAERRIATTAKLRLHPKKQGFVLGFEMTFGT
jgi:hypothetical protein